MTVREIIAAAIWHDGIEVIDVPPPFARFEHFERLPTL
jgi:hypothetical protein